MHERDPNTLEFSKKNQAEAGQRRNKNVLRDAIAICATSGKRSKAQRRSLAPLSFAESQQTRSLLDFSRERVSSSSRQPRPRADSKMRRQRRRYCTECACGRQMESQRSRNNTMRSPERLLSSSVVRIVEDVDLVFDAESRRPDRRSSTL